MLQQEEMTYRELISYYVDTICTAIGKDDNETAQKFGYTMMCEQDRLTFLNNEEDLTVVQNGLRALESRGPYAHKLVADLKAGYRNIYQPAA